MSEPWNDARVWRAQMRQWAFHWRFMEHLRQTRFPLVTSDHPLKCAILCRETALELERGTLSQCTCPAGYDQFISGTHLPGCPANFPPTLTPAGLAKQKNAPATKPGH